MRRAWKVTDQNERQLKYYAAVAKADSLTDGPTSPASSTSFASGLSEPEVGSGAQGFRGFSPRASKSINVKLPQLAVPEFAGAYDRWPQCFYTFRSLIHENEALSAIQRFY